MCYLRALSICKNWPARKNWLWKGQGRPARLLTQSLRGIHARADVNNMADVATRVCNIPPTFFLNFLSPEEEDTLFVKDAEEEVLFFSISFIFSRRELARIAQYFEVTVPRYHCYGYRSHFLMSSSTFELFAQLLAPSEHIPKGNAFGRRPIEARKQIALTVWALANQRPAVKYLIVSTLRCQVCRGALAGLRVLQLYPKRLSFVLCPCQRGRLFPGVGKSIVLCTLCSLLSTSQVFPRSLVLQ